MDNKRYVSPNFITEIIDTDLHTGAHQEIVTRFPPEPNGYLHIGHAKAIYLDFGVALDYGGTTYLRYDDTNPTTEDPEYVKAIQDDVEWLGFKWKEVRHASDYFEELYQLAIRLIKKGLAYVDSQTQEEIRENRGTVTTPGTPSPYRDRSVEENLRLFTEMREGKHPAGSHVLRAKIDLANENMQMRDPILYRIIHADHYRTEDEWPIYPMYDFAHPLSDAIEGITHSLCTLEFDNNRAVYDWLLDNLWERPERPHQYEFARLQLDYTIVSKRKLIRLVEGGFVDGWDDPRMPTLVAFRRRGVRPAAIRDFANRVGIAKANSRTDLALLEHAIRDDLNRVAPRVFAVTEPLLVNLTNRTERGVIDAPSWPAELAIEGSRGVPFGPEVYIERSDFELDPPKGYRRLHPGGAVRLRHYGIITVDEVERDDNGNIIALHATHYTDEEAQAAGVKPTAAIHWVAKHTAVPATFMLYDRLFTQPDPEADGVDYLTLVNPNALQVKEGFVEPSVMHDDPETRYQFERLGYFWRDPKHEGDDLVFNRIVTLKDSWAREQQAAKPVPVAPAKPAAAAEPEAPRELDPAVAKRAAEIVASSHVVQAEAETLAQRPLLDETWQKVVSAGAAAPLAASWVVTEAARLSDEELQAFPVAAFAELLTLLQEETITARVAKELLPDLDADVSVRDLVETRGLGRVADADALETIVRGVLANNPDEVESYRGGKENLLNFFLGQVMRETKGTAAPDVVRELLTRVLQE